MERIMMMYHIEELRHNGIKDFYVNAINLADSEIQLLKKLIKENKISPDIECLKRYIKEEYVGGYLQGDKICPQMNYHIN